MTCTTSFWLDEHARFGRLLDLLEGQLDRFHAGMRPDYAVMLDVVRYMRSYADAVHHPREDLAFEKVAASNPACRARVDALTSEHEGIAESGEALVSLLEAVVDGAIIERTHVEEPGRAYARCLRDHMRREELLFSDVTRLLRDSDWDAIERAVPLRPDPLVVPMPGDAFEGLRSAA